MGAPKTAPLRTQVISEIAVAPGWNLIDAEALVDALIAEVRGPEDGLREAARAAVESHLMRIVNRTKPMDQAEGLAILADLDVALHSTPAAPHTEDHDEATRDRPRVGLGSGAALGPATVPAATVAGRGQGIRTSAESVPTLAHGGSSRKLAGPPLADTPTPREHLSALVEGIAVQGGDDDYWEGVNEIRAAVLSLLADPTYLALSLRSTPAAPAEPCKYDPAYFDRCVTHGGHIGPVRDRCDLAALRAAPAPKPDTALTPCPACGKRDVQPLVCETCGHRWHP